MPNLPVALGRGVVALHGEGDLTDVAALLAPLGLVEALADETQFDLITALAGSGPAFVYRFVDALAAAAEALGLEPAQAARLATASVAGAAALLEGSEVPAADLAARVASKGGSTRMGLDVLDRPDGLRALLLQTLTAAVARNRELGRGSD